MQSSYDLSEEEYNELVFYCESCHSLKILVDDSLAGVDWDGTYCGKCHSTHVGVCKFGDWLKEEERREMARHNKGWNK